MNANKDFLITSAPGLEKLLLEELAELGLEGRVEGDVVRVSGDWPDAAVIMTKSRIASRVLLSVRGAFSAKNPAMLYDQVRRVKWTDYIKPDKTIAVYAHGTNSGADYALSFAPLKIKDAICDEMKKLGVLRPNVDRQNPDVRIEAFIHDGKCELSIDLCGTPLHRRGYREQGGEAPLRENRAAALLRFVGYDGSKPFMDPFCGSGTIPIEAALIATHTAPGLLRDSESYAFWNIFPEAQSALLKERAKATSERRPKAEHPIKGMDFSSKILNVARENARRAGLANVVSFAHGDATEVKSPGSFIVANPPYGVRLEDKEAACALLGAFTRQVKHACADSTLGLVVEAGDLEKATGFKPSKKLLVKSGTMELRFLRFEIFAGRARSAAKTEE